MSNFVKSARTLLYGMLIGGMALYLFPQGRDIINEISHPRTVDRGSALERIVNEDYTEQHESYSCTNDTIFNGEYCKPIEYLGETILVGFDEPVGSREELDAIERSFVRRSFNDFPEYLFVPETQLEAQVVQSIRQNNWKKQGKDNVREWEFIVNDELLDDLKQNYHVDNVAAMLGAHERAINEIWSNSTPDINMQANLDRIIVVSSDVLSDRRGGWEIVNDTNYMWWANDKMNGEIGFIPFDIDSRWALGEDWTEIFHQFIPYGEYPVDYGLLHELTHHLPVGDNYLYVPGAGHGFTFEHLGKEIVFDPNDVLFMHNDHMTGTTNRELSAPSAYNTLLFWELNPSLKRTPQFLDIYDVKHIYGRYFFDELKININGLDELGFDRCIFVHEDMSYMEPIPTSHPFGESDFYNPFSLIISQNHRKLDFNENSCELILNRDDQSLIYPGAHILLEKGNMQFPVHIPSNLIQTLYWKEAITAENIPNNYTFDINATEYISEAFSLFSQIISSSEDNEVKIHPYMLKSYIDVIDESNLPEDTMFYADIDGESKYIIEFFDRFEKVSPSTPTIDRDTLDAAFVYIDDRQNYDLFLWDDDLIRLTNDEFTNYHPSWSPDGSQLAYLTGKDNLNVIRLINRDGTDRRTLFDQSDISDLLIGNNFEIEDVGYMTAPMFSPTQNKLVFSVNFYSGNLSYLVPNIYDLENDSIHTLDEIDRALNTVWSPTGSHLFISAVDNQRNYSGGYVYNTLNEELTKISFPHDASHFNTQWLNNDEIVSIWRESWFIYNTETNSQIKIQADEWILQFAVSPVSEDIIYSIGESNNLYRVNLRNNDPEPLLPDYFVEDLYPGAIRDLEYSRDGTKLGFNRGNEFYIMNLEDNSLHLVQNSRMKDSMYEFSP